MYQSNENLPEPINKEVVTLADCYEKYSFRNMCTILRCGKVVDFFDEDISTDKHIGYR